MTTKTSAPFDHDALLGRNGLTQKEFQSTGLQWAALEGIYEHHKLATPGLNSVGNFVLQRLQAPGIHSLKMRIKHPEHLVAKIIRKKLERPEETFTLESYEAQITDLIGLRALHLFKHEWRSVDDFVRKTWELHEDPIAYVRPGDPDQLLDDFKSANCKVVYHQFGYRSIHYLLKSQPDKKNYVAELQVRTIFEEGWSEIDHRVRYPRRSEEPYLDAFLRIFSGLSGSADEMGTFINVFSALVREQAEKIADGARVIEEKEAALEKAISALKISQGEKDSLRKQIDAVRSPSAGLADQLTLINSLAGATTADFSAFKILPLVSKGDAWNWGNTRQQPCRNCKKLFTPGPLYTSSVASFGLCSDCAKYSPGL